MLFHSCVNRAAWLHPLFLLLGFAVSACGGSTQSGGAPSPLGTNPSSNGFAAAPELSEVRSTLTSLPGNMVVAPGDGPALYLTESPDAPAVGYISGGVAVQLLGEPEGGRVPVVIEGPLRARGWIPESRLAMRIQQRGKVRGTPIYVGPGDVVGIAGRSQEQGLMNLRVQANLGREGVSALGPFQGEYPESRLTGVEMDFTNLEGPTAGPAFSLPQGVEVPVYDSPGGSVVATLPATNPPLVVTVLRDRAPWKGIRAGVGPYLVGYVQAELAPATAVPARGASPALAAGQVPQRLADEDTYPLHRVARGTQVVFDGRVVAVLQAAGYARELNRYGETGEADVFVAVSNDMAVRGMVDASLLGAAAPPPAGAPAPVTAPSVAPVAPAPAPAPAAPAPAPRRTLVSPGAGE